MIFHEHLLDRDSTSERSDELEGGGGYELQIVWLESEVLLPPIIHISI